MSPYVSLTDVEMMRPCLLEATAAGVDGEVPVGAMVVRKGLIVGRGRNASVRLKDPSAHAEIMALRAAGELLGNYRFPDAELYVTVEPCLMCVGAIIQARIRRVVFGCRDPKGGALGSVTDFSNYPGLNHSFTVVAGVCEEEARNLLQHFFQERRGKGTGPSD
jgi:tRNA(adenine34) deaminase